MSTGATVEEYIELLSAEQHVDLTKLRAYARHGVQSSVRGEAWLYLLGILSADKSQEMTTVRSKFLEYEGMHKKNPIIGRQVEFEAEKFWKKKLAWKPKPDRRLVKSSQRIAAGLGGEKQRKNGLKQEGASEAEAGVEQSNALQLHTSTSPAPTSNTSTQPRSSSDPTAPLSSPLKQPDSADLLSTGSSEPSKICDSGALTPVDLDRDAEQLHRLHHPMRHLPFDPIADRWPEIAAEAALARVDGAIGASGSAIDVASSAGGAADAAAGQSNALGPEALHHFTSCVDNVICAFLNRSAWKRQAAREGRERLQAEMGITSQTHGASGSRALGSSNGSDEKDTPRERRERNHSDSGSSTGSRSSRYEETARSTSRVRQSRSQQSSVTSAATESTEEDDGYDEDDEYASGMGHSAVAIPQQPKRRYESAPRTPSKLQWSSGVEASDASPYYIQSARSNSSTAAAEDGSPVKRRPHGLQHELRRQMKAREAKGAESLDTENAVELEDDAAAAETNGGAGGNDSNKVASEEKEGDDMDLDWSIPRSAPPTPVVNTYTSDSRGQQHQQQSQHRQARHRHQSSFSVPIGGPEAAIHKEPANRGDGSPREHDSEMGDATVQPNDSDLSSIDKASGTSVGRGTNGARSGMGANANSELQGQQQKQMETHYAAVAYPNKFHPALVYLCAPFVQCIKVEAGMYFAFEKVMRMIEEHHRREPLHSRVATFLRLFRRTLPELFAYFEEEEVDVVGLASRWLQDLLASEMQMQDLLRLWDTYFAVPDPLDLHLYVCIAILMNCRDSLEELDQSEAKSMLFSLPPLDVDQIINDAINIQISHQQSQMD